MPLLLVLEAVDEIGSAVTEPLSEGEGEAGDVDMCTTINVLSDVAVISDMPLEVATSDEVEIPLCWVFA